MSGTEKKIILFLVAAFIVGNVVLFVKKERLRSKLASFRIEEVVERVSINKGSREELEMLPGIGPVLAQRIVDYRKGQGRFGRPEDLLKVEGITQRHLVQIRDLIILE